MKPFHVNSPKNEGKRRDNDSLKEMWSNTLKNVPAIDLQSKLLWQNSQLHENNDVFYMICDLYLFL